MVGAHKHRGPAFDGLYRALRHEQRCGAAARKLDRRRHGLAHAPLAGSVVDDRDHARKARGFIEDWGDEIDPRHRSPIARQDLDLRAGAHLAGRSEEHTSELQSLMRISYAVFCLKKKTKNKKRPAPSK